MKNSTLNLLILLTTLFLIGCISTEAINKKLTSGISPESASHSCFDIGTPMHSNLLTDDYFEALEVTDGISCVKALADRGPYSDEERARYIYDVLTFSLNKSFLSDDVLEAIKSESKTYQDLMNKHFFKRELKENTERENLRVKSNKKTTALCGKNRVGTRVRIGDNEDCLLHIMGWPDDINTTTTKYNTSKQYVFENGRDTTYVYTTNGAITAIQD